MQAEPSRPTTCAFSYLRLDGTEIRTCRSYPHVSKHGRDGLVSRAAEGSRTHGVSERSLCTSVFPVVKTLLNSSSKGSRIHGLADACGKGTFVTRMCPQPLISRASHSFILGR